MSSWVVSSQRERGLATTLIDAASHCLGQYKTLKKQNRRLAQVADSLIFLAEMPRGCFLAPNCDKLLHNLGLIINKYQQVLDIKGVAFLESRLAYLN